MAEPAEQLLEKRRLRLLQNTIEREGFAKGFDGTRIAYRSVGNGQPAIVCCNGLGVSTFFWTYLERHLSPSHRIVTWDYRGHGRSSLKGNARNYTLKALVKDLEAVVRTLKIKKAIFIGHSVGTQVILEYYRQNPRQVAALIPAFGTYGHLMETFYNLSFSPLIMRLVYFLGTTFPKQGNLISRIFLTNPLSSWIGGILKIMNTGMMSEEDIHRYIEHIVGVDPRLFSTLLKNAHELSSEDLLPRIQVPTLIIAGDEDKFTPPWIAKKMHRLIPHSELFMIHKATHAGLVEHPALFNLRVEKFLRERLP